MNKLSELKSSKLTYLAEAIGESADSECVRKVLLPLLQHRDAVVREGAVYGLSNHIDEAVRRELQSVAEYDYSPAVRTAAREALE